MRAKALARELAQKLQGTHFGEKLVVVAEFLIGQR